MPSLSPTAVYVKSMTMTNHANKSKAQKNKEKQKNWTEAEGQNTAKHL